MLIKNVKLSDGMEYLNYSIRVEQLKSSYKILFSIYDKTAFFINDLWKLGFKEKMASADRVFKSKNYPRDNVSLTAMKWVYMEFCEKFGNAEAAYEKELKDLRNALEHKYVKVHEYKWKKEINVSLTAMKWVYMEFCEKFGNAEAAYEKELKDLRNAL
ncbi:hypothetical protein DWX80_18510, partial [Ruminococcus sp. AF21-3]